MCIRRYSSRWKGTKGIVNKMISKLGDICDKIGSGLTPTGGSSVYTDSGVAFIRSQNVLNMAFSIDGLTFIDESIAGMMDNVSLCENDILLNITGDSVARMCLVPKEILPARVNQHVCIVRVNVEKANPRFVYYQLCGLQKKLLSLASVGATRKALTKQMIEELELELPVRQLQDNIAYTIDSIQSKIDYNKAINDNLEAQIRACFDEISNKPNLTETSLGNRLYIKGRIGWKGLKKEEYLEKSNYRIINGEALTPSGIDWDKAGYITEERYLESPEIMLEPDDIVLSKDGTIGKIGYIHTLDLPTTVASGIFVIRSLQKDYLAPHFIYQLLKSPKFKGFVEGRKEGSAIPHLYQRDFIEFLFPLPLCEDLQLFNKLTHPLFQKLIENEKEIKQLTALRDYLLPKLMSGEVDVSTLEIPN